MLILHPESQCDICLEHYTCNSPGQSPHTIPCGHVFCEICLRTFRPPNCPLCRKHFVSDQIKKLHVDRPEPDKAKQIDFLNQLILGWCEMDDEQFEVLLSPVQNWLAPKDVHECQVLRKAVVMLNRCQLLRAQHLSDCSVMEKLVNRIREDALEKVKRRENWNGLESQLRQEIQDLKTTVRLKDGEIEQLTKLAADHSRSAEILVLTAKMTMRQLRLLVKKQEETIGSLLNLISLLRLNPLPRPPEPVPFERQPHFSQTLTYNNRRIPMMTAHENNENPNDSSLSPTRIPKNNNKGKEREPGPSYNLSSITSSITTATTPDSTTTPIVAHPLSTSQDRTSSILSPEQVLRSASPHCNVVPTSTSKPVAPDALIEYDPKLVSEARPDQLVPPRPPNPLISLYHGSMGRQGQTVSDPPHLRLVREPVIARVDSARGFVDPCTVTAAHVSEYTVGYGAGYHLAEYTPGEAARVITDLPQVNASTSAVACANPDMNERWYGERETEGQKGLDNMNLVSNALPKIVGAAPIARSRQGGNSQVYSNHVVSGGPVLQALSFNRTDDHQNLQMAPLHYSSFVSESQSQKTRVAGYQTESETSTTRFLGLTEDGLSTREVPQSHHTSGSGFSFALYGTTNPDETTTSSRTRPSHQTSLPSQSVKPILVPVTTIPDETTISAVVTTAEPSSARGTTTHLTSDNVRTTSSPSTHLMPLLGWQGTGSSLDFHLRGFACGAGTTMMRSTDVNRGPRLPVGMTVSHYNIGNSTASVNRKEANDGNGFPILRESDEERTPLSRSPGILAPLHALSDWLEVRCHAEDAFSTSHPHLQYDTYPSNQFNSQGLLTSPTLFNSNSNTNALGLDGLNEPQPLHIAAPTPVVSTMSFLKSFSQ